MRIAYRLSKLKEVCIQHFDELKEENGTIQVFRHTEKSYEIWGGNGDHDEDHFYFLDQTGWKVRITVTETGVYQKGKSGILSNKVEEASESMIEAAVNGESMEPREFLSLIGFMNRISELYPREFTY